MVSSNKHIVFRTDASLDIGTGHVIRCLTLAEKLRDKGAQVHFICRTHEGSLHKLIEKKGFKVFCLQVPSAEIHIENQCIHEHWLGVPWQKDAEDTSEILQDFDDKPAWLVVDHYGLDHRWQKQQRDYVCQIMVIDDLADRKHDCDLLLDQNLVEGFEQRYVGLVPKSSSFLCGPQYSLLQPMYAEFHDCIPFREGPIKRILVFIGGADAGNISGMVLGAFLALSRNDIEIDVVVGHTCPHRQCIYDMAQPYPNISVHDSLPTLAPLIARADLAIGGGGSATWERFCLGLPTLVITLAENQKLIADWLHRLELIHLAGDRKKITSDSLQNSLQSFVAQDINKDWSKRCHATVDGQGTRRVAATLLASHETPLQVRRARVSDEALLLEWANDPETRQNAFTMGQISQEEHHAWFNSRLRDIAACSIFIVETSDETPVGQVRLQRTQEKSYGVHYSLAKCFRGRKIGKNMLEVALKHFSSKYPVENFVAYVKKENIASQKIFNQLNFSRHIDSDNNAILKFNLQLT